MTFTELKHARTSWGVDHILWPMTEQGSGTREVTSVAIAMATNVTNTSVEWRALDKPIVVRKRAISCLLAKECVYKPEIHQYDRLRV